MTSLHLAAVKGHAEVTKLLLDHHADIAIKDNYGNTALHAARDNNELETAKLLLQKQ